MKNYAALDAQIIKVISEGCRRASVIQSACMMQLDLFGSNDDNQMRVLDRRLQALRKAKKIEYRGGWALYRPRP